MKNLMIFVFLLISACNGKLGADRAIEIASAYAEKKFPEAHVNVSRVEVHDEGKTWKVTWKVSEGMNGGMPVVWVDKGNGKIVKGFSYQ